MGRTTTCSPVPLSSHLYLRAAVSRLKEWDCLILRYCSGFLMSARDNFPPLAPAPLASHDDSSQVQGVIAPSSS